MARDNVTFSFRIDSARASAAIKELTQALERLNATNVKVDKNLKTTKTGIDQVGRSSAASAVNFQTATQGMLNLSTAAVQTYTSISNLDRANNRARMSVIAVARAEDLLNSKKVRLNELTEQGITSGGKYANMVREIATAEADRTEKIEKMKIEQAAVNDIYMLFATNIANVVISSMQTVVILLGQERVARLASAAATRIQSASLLRHITITGISIKQLTLLNLTTKIGTAITLGYVGSIKAATIAMMQFTRSNGVLIAITATAVGLLAAYETNFLGLKTAIDGLLGTESEHISLLEEQRKAADALDAANNDMANTFEFTIPKSLGIATIELAKHRGEYEKIVETQKEMIKLSNKVPVPTGGPKTVGELIQERNAHDFRDARKGETFFGIKLPEFVPPSYAAEQNFMPAFALQGNDEITLRKLAIDFLAEYVSSPTFREQIFRQQQTVSGLSKQMSPELQAQQRIDQYGDPASPEFQDKLAAQMAGISLKEYQLRKVFTTTMPADTGRTLFKGRGIEALKGKIVNGVPIGNVLRGKLMLAQRRAAEAPFTQDPEEFADITDPEDELTQVQYARLLAAQKGIGGSMVLTAKERKIFDKIGKGLIKGKRAEVLITTGEDIGAAANVMDIESALLLGAIQQSQRQFNRTSADPFVSDFDKLSRQSQVGYLVGNRLGPGASKGKTPTFSDVVRMSTLEAQQYSVRNIAGIGGRADAAIAQSQARRQIEDNMTVRASQAFYDRIAEQDRIANLKRFGGYSSRKAQSEAGKRARSLSNKEAQLFMRTFGGGLPSGYMSSRSRAGHMQSLREQTNIRKTALANAGLSYKSFNVRLGSRASIRQRLSYKELLRETISYNNNQYAKAGLINMLEQDFGATGFIGSPLSLPSLQEAVANQDELIKSIGLDRTEAFQIVDTAGRGREEIDDRVRFKDRLSSMSTGVSVL